MIESFNCLLSLADKRLSSISERFVIVCVNNACYCFIKTIETADDVSEYNGVSVLIATFMINKRLKSVEMQNLKS